MALKVEVKSFLEQDVSGTISAAGTSQLLINSSENINGFNIYNTDSVDYLWISVGRTAVVQGLGSIGIPPLGLFEYPITSRPNGDVNILGNRAGQIFTAKKY